MSAARRYARSLDWPGIVAWIIAAAFLLAAAN